jgi:hypothetical protein
LVKAGRSQKLRGRATGVAQKQNYAEGRKPDPPLRIHQEEILPSKVEKLALPGNPGK